jgi:phosphatidylglycerophosphate synthase
MFERIPVLESKVDRAARPIARFLHLGIGLSPLGASWAGFGASVLGAAAVAIGHLYPGLALVAVGQLFDGLDGMIAREFNLATLAGARLDTIFDRASEAVIFLGFYAGGFVSLRLALLAFSAILLLTTISERSRFDLGFKRSVLYFGHWVPYPALFTVTFVVNLAAYVIGLLILDIKFQHRMDALGGDLDTIASRAAELEASEKKALDSLPTT